MPQGRRLDDSGIRSAYVETLQTLSTMGLVPEGTALPEDVQWAVATLQQQDNLLTLDCTWHGGIDGEVGYSHIVTIRLGDTENEFRYIANKIV